jgi:Domain of unknown function (DUF4145)
VIEGICIDKKIEKGEVTDAKGNKKMSKGLDGKIEALNATGNITRANADVLHELRFLGNEALHELTAPSLDELRLAITIVENTIDNLYELKHKGGLLKEESARRKGKSQPGAKSGILFSPPPSQKP